MKQGFSPDSGHYYAYIKDAIGRWYCCNDSYVSVSNKQEVLSEKVYILFFSRAKPRPRTQLDAVVNGSKTHESNGSKTSTIQKFGSVDRSVCSRQFSNHLKEANKSTNGSRSFKKFGCLEKSFGLKIPANHSDSNRSNNWHASNGAKTLACQRPGHVETPSNMGDHSGNQPETCNITTLGISSGYSTYGQSFGNCVEKIEVKESSDHHSQTSDLVKSEIGHQLPDQQRTSSDSMSTRKVLAHGNMRFSVLGNEPRKGNGYTAASLTAVEKEKMGRTSNGNNICKKSADCESTKRVLSLPSLNDGDRPMTMDSSQRNFPKVNGSTLTTNSQKSLNCQDLSNGELVILGALKTHV